MKILIVYFSWTGNNALLAEELKNRLDADLYQIRELRPRKALTTFFDMLFHRRSKIYKPALPLKKYDQVLLLTPVWNARISSPLRAFIQYYKDEFPKYTLLTVCGGRQGQQQQLESEVTKLAGKSPAMIVQFPLNKLLPAERKQMIRQGAQLKLEKSDLSYLAPSLDQLIQKLKMYETA